MTNELFSTPEEFDDMEFWMQFEQLVPGTKLRDWTYRHYASFWCEKDDDCSILEVDALSFGLLLDALKAADPENPKIARATP